MWYPLYDKDNFVSFNRNRYRSKVITVPRMSKVGGDIIHFEKRCFRIRHCPFPFLNRPACSLRDKLSWLWLVLFRVTKARNYVIILRESNQFMIIFLLITLNSRRPFKAGQILIGLWLLCNFTDVLLDADKWFKVIEVLGIIKTV